MAIPVITTVGPTADKVTANNGTATSYQIVASGSPTSYAITSGGPNPVPPGMSLNTSTGLVSGTPTQNGKFQGNMTATNASGTSAVKVLFWYVSPALTPRVTSALFVNITAGAPATYTIVGNNTPTSFIAQSLPNGLTVDTVTGIISGTVADGPGGTVVSAIRGVNSHGNGCLTDLTWFIAGSTSTSPPVITSPLAVDAVVGDTISYQIVATDMPTMFGMSHAPSGWTIDTVSGIITSPVLTVAGIITFSIKASNSSGSDTQTIVFTITDGSGGGGLPPPPPPLTKGSFFTYIESTTFAEGVIVNTCPLTSGVTGLPPGPPTNLVITVTSDTTATVTWTPPTGNNI